MPNATAALTGLLPIVGAVALLVKGAARLRARSRHASCVPPQPKEHALSGPSPSRQRKPLPDVSCERCGTSIPGTDTLCPFCEREREGAGPPARGTALNWLAFIALMAVIFGVGALLSH